MANQKLVTLTPRNVVVVAMLKNRKYGGVHSKTHKRQRCNDKVAILKSLEA